MSTLDCKVVWKSPVQSVDYNEWLGSGLWHRGTTLHYTTLHTTQHYTAEYSTSLWHRGTTLLLRVLNFTALHCTAINYTVFTTLLHWTSLYYSALHFTELYFICIVTRRGMYGEKKVVSELTICHQKWTKIALKNFTRLRT